MTSKSSTQPHQEGLLFRIACPAGDLNSDATVVFLWQLLSVLEINTGGIILCLNPNTLNTQEDVLMGHGKPSLGFRHLEVESGLSPNIFPIYLLPESSSRNSLHSMGCGYQRKKSRPFQLGSEWDLQLSKGLPWAFSSEQSHFQHLRVL